MTTIALSTDLPTELNTLEKLTYHNCLAMNLLYSNQQIPLNTNERQFSRSQIQIGRALDGKMYAVCTLAFELDETIVQANPSNLKPWRAAYDWGQVAYPAAFRQNSPT